MSSSVIIRLGDLGAEQPEPSFKFELGEGMTVHFRSLRDAPWDNVITPESTTTQVIDEILYLAIPDEREREALYDANLTLGEMEKLLDRYVEHYGLSQDARVRRFRPNRETRRASR